MSSPSTFPAPIPARLARRPKDARGYPIPAGVLVDEEGKPDFRVTDIRKWVALAESRCCALCGEPLGRHLAFVGGPLAHQNRFFTDLPMHRECAEYALQVCPFLAAPNFRYAESVRPGPGIAQLTTSDLVVPERPEKFFLGVTRSFQLVQGPDGTVLAYAAAWEQVTWWQLGHPLK